jgi:hypothetical protein
MSKVRIQGDAGGTGIFTVIAPATNTDRTITLPDSAGTLLTSSSVLPKSIMPSGSILQVIQTLKTDAFAGSIGALWSDVSGMSVTITPSSVNNKILVTVDMKGAGTMDSSVVRSRLLRNSTPIYIGDAASLRPQAMGQFYISSGGSGQHYLAQLGGTFLDSPATTSPVTYKIQIGADGTTQIVYVNRTQGDRDANVYDSRVAATITVMEIAA